MIIVDPPDKGSDIEFTTNTSGGRISHSLIGQVSRIRLNPQTGAFYPFPEPSSPAELDQWLQSVELSLKDGGILRSEWPDAAILFLDGDGNVNKAMRSLRYRRFQQGFSAWSWEEFIAELREVLSERDARHFSLQTLRNDHPVATTVAGSLLIAAVSPPLFVGALNVVGFGSGGVAAGSIAAGAQSIFYGAATTGLFSACQSAGAAGLGVAATTLISAIGGAAGFTLLGGKGKDNEDKPTQTLENDSSTSPPPYRA